MDGNPAQQAFKELLPYLETLETQTAAILQLLKDKGLTTDEEFAPYLERAGNASNVKWLAARIRLDHLLSAVDKDKDKKENAEKKKVSSSQASADQETSKKDSEQKEENRETEKTASSGEDQSGQKSKREARDATTADPKQGQEKKEVDQEKTKNTLALQSEESAGNPRNEDSGKQMKETRSKADENPDTERNTGKKAS